jgi:crotonobetainyl-CoA:carnitine CoA-transferase CaiB-like acyl-CoA transferase
LFPYDAFETADGLVVIGVIGEKQWRLLCEAMGLPDFADEYASQERRIEDRKMLREIIAEWVAVRTSQEVLDALEGDLPCAPVQDVSGVFTDPIVRQRQMLVDVVQPACSTRSATARGTSTCIDGFSAVTARRGSTGSTRTTPTSRPSPRWSRWPAGRSSGRSREWRSTSPGAG